MFNRFVKDKRMVCVRGVSMKMNYTFRELHQGHVGMTKTCITRMSSYLVQLIYPGIGIFFID